MDWKTILTSGVIVAVISGIIELFKLNNSNKATFVIKQREEWRNKIRLLAKELNEPDIEFIKETLMNLKVNINPYGLYIKNKKQEITDIKCFKKTRQRFYKKKNDSLLEKYYLQDGHINNIIDALIRTSSTSDIETYKNVLYEYISCLLKFDWERSKCESLMDKYKIFSIMLGFFSLSILGFYLYNEQDVSLHEMIFVVCYFSLPLLTVWFLDSGIIKLDLIRGIRGFCVFVMLIFLFIGGLIVHYMEDEIMIFLIALTLLSFLMAICAIFQKRMFVNEYVNTLKKIDEKNKIKYVFEKEIKQVQDTN